MGDRGNCKCFAPNYFNPTKCQNCFKPKEQHCVQDTSASGKLSAAGKSGSVYGGRNATVSKRLLKESVLLKSHLGRDKIMPEIWERHWFALYSNGELQEYAIVDGQINKEIMTSSVMLQEFIRMLDGKVELGEDLCFGVKTLRDTIYFKTTTKVDYENWWKEISSFVASPLKRTTSVTNPKSNLSALTRQSLCKQLSVPISSISPTRSSRSSSISSLHSDPDHPQIDILRSQISKLEEENDKLSKVEDQRRKLELEVNYWKEYVTNAQLIKRSGGSTDNFTELADARRQLIQLQDELNQSQKKLKSNTGKLLMRNKEVTDCKEKLRESNSIIAVYKAKIDQLSKEISSKNHAKDITAVVTISKGGREGNIVDKKTEVGYLESSEIINTDARHLEDKFLLLKDKLKRIERELLIKSKELEKANESRSKVAKYTRSLLQELETRLSDNQQKLSVTEEKLKNVSIELVMERERRIKLEEGPRRRMSNIVMPGKSISHTELFHSAGGIYNPPVDHLTEHDADTKYADYYRSRFKEAESSLLEKDKKLHQAEEKIKEIQTSMKHNSDNYKVMDELQSKLSDATHKLSDRQLKIHELTCEIGRLKEFEKTYGKKRQQCGTLEDIVKDLENANSVLTKNLHQVKQESEILKIREVVLKEQLQTFADDSDDSDSDDASKLGKSVDLKNKIECMVDLESRCKKLALNNETLMKKSAEFEIRLRHINMQNFRSLESSRDFVLEENIGNNCDQNENKIKELEQSLAKEEDRFCKQLTIIKERHLNEISTLEKNYETDIASSKDEVEKCRIEIDKLLAIKSEMEIKIQQFSEKVSAFESEVKLPQMSLCIGSKDQQEMDNLQTNPLYYVGDFDPLIQEDKSCRMAEVQLGKVSSVLIDEAENNDVNNGLSKDPKFMDSGKTLQKSQGDYSIEKDYIDTGCKDRDSGIVITQEIKSMIDASKSNNTEIMIDDNFYWEFSNSGTKCSTILHDSVLEIDTIEKCKMVCSKFQITIRELSSKYVTSEEKTIELAQILQQKAISEQAFVFEYDILLGRIDELESQIIESQESLQSKADELEKERKNVINLVEVTSAYIKELEGSLEESKTKINNLQSNKKDGIIADETILIETDNEEAKTVRQKLTAKIMTLQSDISELTENHVRELKVMNSECQQEVENVRKQFSGQILMSRVESLEKELEEQNQHYLNEVELLNQHFQAELKQAFSGDNAGIDMLNRMQELEMEVEETRKVCEFKIKEMQDNHELEKNQIEDMATALQATLSAKLSGEFIDAYEPSNFTVEELEERIIKLEQELIDMGQKYNDDLEMEKRAHQAEMEDTIRDMMMVRHATTRYSDTDDKDIVGKLCGTDTEICMQSSSVLSSEEVDVMKANHKEELKNLANEHEEELCQIRSDFSIVISSLKQGNSSDTIMDLQGKLKEYEQESQDLKKKFRKDIDNLEGKLKRAESANFFAVRRNEEMGGKIYHMQIELEEMDRNHQMEVATYQEKLGCVDGGQGNDVNDCIKQNEEFKHKNKLLERELEDLRNEHEQKIDAFIIKLQEEKREEIEEMTDKVLKLEALIDEMKENRNRELKAFEKSNREEKVEAVILEKGYIKELETMCETLKVEYEEEIEELSKEHRKEVEKLRVFYEKEIGDIKRRLSSGDDIGNRKNSVDQTSLQKQVIKEKNGNHENEVTALKSHFTAEKEAMESQHQRTIDNIRQQYDEKLQLNYKEGLRRQSLTECKSDCTKLRQLASEKEDLSKKLLEQEIKYKSDMKQKIEQINELQKILENVKIKSNHNKIDMNKDITNLTESENILECEMQKKVKEIREQIERYDRRIEYYLEKSTREGTEESPRVSELQSEIVKLHKEMNKLKETKRKKGFEKETQEKASSTKIISRRNADGISLRRHTDNVTVKSRKRELDPRKRWSNLEESSGKDESKSGTVLARKTLWENISAEDGKLTGQ